MAKRKSKGIRDLEVKQCGGTDEQDEWPGSAGKLAGVQKRKLGSPTPRW